MYKRILSILVFGFIFTGCTDWRSNPLVQPPLPTNEEVIFPTPNSTSESSLIINDQPGTNLTIVVESVSLNNPGFVAVYRNDNNEPGTLLGFSDLITQPTEDVNISLNTNLEEGDSLIARLHQDINGSQDFNYPGPDVPVLDVTGNQISTVFYIKQ